MTSQNEGSLDVRDQLVHLVKEIPCTFDHFLRLHESGTVSAFQSDCCSLGIGQAATKPQIEGEE